MASTRIDDGLHPGRLLTRREALALIGASGAALLAGAAPGRAQAPSSAAARPSCVARPQQTEGPFFVEEALNRSDIRSDPRSGESRPGVPLRLTFNVSRLSGAGCGPLAGAQFLRGYQIADAAGNAKFLTIYPGCYGGRAVHVHYKIRTGPAAARSYAFTSQLYFDEALTARVYAAEPYASQSRQWMRNASDGIFRSGGRQLLLSPEPDGQGYAAAFDIGLQV